MVVTSSAPTTIPSAGTWLTTSNVFSSNDVYATNVGTTQNTEYPLDVGGFNFAALPSDAIIVTVTVTVEAKTGTAARAQIKGELYDGATLLGGLSLTNLTAADANYTFTGTATAAQLQSANLKVRVTNKRIVSQASTTSVDYVKIDVTWLAHRLTSALPAFTDPAWQVTPPATATATVATGVFPNALGDVTQMLTLDTVWTLDSLSVRLLGLPTGVTSSEVVLVSVLSGRGPDTGIDMQWTGNATVGSFAAYVIVAGNSTRIGGTPAWNPAIPYLRMRLAGPTLFIEQSANAATWTLYGSVNHGLDLSTCRVYYRVGGTSVATPTIDQLNVNLTPSARVKSVLSYYQTAVQRSNSY